MKKFTSKEIKEFVSKAMFDEKVILNSSKGNSGDNKYVKFYMY